jgi:hypothetical protein
LERLLTKNVKEQEIVDSQWKKLIPEITNEYSKAHADSYAYSGEKQCHIDAIKDLRRLVRLREEYIFAVDASDSIADSTVRDRTKEVLEIINLAAIMRESAEKNNNLLGLNGGQVFLALFNKNCLQKLFYRYSRLIKQFCNEIYKLTDNHLKPLSLGKRCKNFFTSKFRTRKRFVQHIESLKKQLDFLYSKMEELVAISEETGLDEVFQLEIENGRQILEEMQEEIDKAYSHFSYYRDQNLSKG